MAETRNAPGTPRRSTVPTAGATEKATRDRARDAIATAVKVPSGPDSAQTDARARIRAILDSYGLAELGDMSWDLITRGASEAEIWREVEATQPYKTRFKALIEWNAKGIGPAQTEEQYLNFEREGAAYMRAAGMPPSFYDEQSDFAAAYAGGVSLNELNQRVVNGYQAVSQMDPLVREQARMWGATDGMLASFFLDPDRSLPAVLQAVQGAQIAAESIRTGFGQLSRDEADRLTELGVTASTAAQGFNALGSSTELFSTIPGEGGPAVTREEQLGAAFANDVAAQDKISRRARARVAAQESGGGAVVTAQGAVGLGSAAS